jgi:hypothetical protein
LFTATGDVWSIDAGPQGSVDAALVERPAELVKLSLSGARPETIATSAQVPEGNMVLALSDGRTVITEHVMGHDRLMAVETGKSHRDAGRLHAQKSGEAEWITSGLPK